MGTAIGRLVRDERGATAIEYALIAVLVSIAIIGAASAMGTSIGRLFTYAADQVSNVAP